MEELFVDLRPKLVSIQFILKIFSCLLCISEKFQNIPIKLPKVITIVLELCGMLTINEQQHKESTNCSTNCIYNSSF